MSQILRPTKVGGTNRYTTEVQAGNDLIREIEVDGDFDTLYEEFNGGIDDDNINVGLTGPKIAYEKLALTGKLEPADFDPTPIGQLPPAWVPTIPSGGLGPDTVGSAQIINGSILSEDIGTWQVQTDNIGPGVIVPAHLAPGFNIETAKIAVGATIYAVNYVRRSDTVACTALNDERLYLEYTWTSRGGHFVIVAALHSVFGVDGNLTPCAGWVSNLRIDGSPGVPTDGSVVDFQWFQDMSTAPTGGQHSATATTVLGFTGQVGAGTHRVKVTGKPINRFLTYANIDSGWGLVVEFA
jgi:hypothetical protein